MPTPSNSSNVVDFATYRFARDLRLTEARDAAARLAPAAAAPARDARLSEADVAHRARMLQHLALGRAQSDGRQ
jgi:hypothetical protein